MSTVKADRFQESTPGAGVTIAGAKFPPGDSPLDAAIPRGRRITTTLADYLDRNKLINSKDYLQQTGVANDYLKFLDMQTDAGANGTLDMFAGSTLIDAGGAPGAQAVVTVPQSFRPRRGFMLKTGANTLVRFTGPMDQNILFQWIDDNANVDFVGNRSVPWYFPQWWGVVGDDNHADYLPMTKAMNSVADWSNFWFSQNMKMQLDYMVIALNRTGLTLFSNGWPMDLFGGNDGGPMFRWRGPAAGIMVGFYNCGYITVHGILFDGGTASCGLDFDAINIGVTNASSAITSNDVPNGTAAAGPGIFTSLPAGYPINLRGVGSAGATLMTTLTPVDANHATIAGVASLTSSFIWSSFGPMANPFPTTRINSRNMVTRCRFVGGIGTRKFSCIGITRTALTNAEDFIIRENYLACNGNVTPGHAIPYLGGSFRRAQWGGTANPAPPAGLTMIAGTNDLLFTSGGVDFATPDMEGVPFTIGRAGANYVGGGLTGGPNNGPAPLDGFLHYVSPQHVQMRDSAGAALNAVNTVPSTGFPLAFMIDEAMGIGVEIGYSQEPHHTIFENNLIASCGVGISAGGGSHHEWMDEYQDCGINKFMNNRQANPSSAYGTNCENSRMHLFTLTTAQYTERGARWAISNVKPGGGWFTFFGGGPVALIEDSQIEGDLGDATDNAGSAIFDMGKSAGQILNLNRNSFLNNVVHAAVDLPGVLKDMGFATLPSGNYIEMKGNQAPFLPYELTVSSEAFWFNFSLKRHIGGQVFLSANKDWIPAAGDFLPGMTELAIGGADAVADHAHQVMTTKKHVDGVLRVHKIPQLRQKKIALGAPADLAAGATQSFDIAMDGVVVGDQVAWGFDQDMPGIWWARVKTNGQVRFSQYNNTGAAFTFQPNPSYWFTAFHFDTF